MSLVCVRGQFQHSPAAVKKDESCYFPINLWVKCHCLGVYRDGKVRQAGRFLSQKTCLKYALRVPRGEGKEVF